MSNVNLAIGGRTFTVACAKGEESHVAELGRMVDDKVTASGAIAQNETRMLLFAALMLADEVHEIRTAMTRDSSANAEAMAANAGIAQRVDQITLRIEALAHLIETPGLEDEAAIS